MNDLIQSLWIGNKLSTMERLSISSFLKNGHEYHLYCYEDIEGIPAGTVIKDGNDILPEKDIFVYKKGEGSGSPSAFSNFFRYKLVTEKGGYWVDTDFVCLRHFDFEEKYVFSCESIPPFKINDTHINAGIIKAPAGNPVTQHMYNTCLEKIKADLVWGEIGPRLVKSTVESFGLTKFVKNYSTFCPIPGCQWVDLLQPFADFREWFSGNYAIHLWNEMWRRSNVDKDAKFNYECLYEQLKREYL